MFSGALELEIYIYIYKTTASLPVHTEIQRSFLFRDFFQCDYLPRHASYMLQTYIHLLFL